VLSTFFIKRKRIRDGKLTGSVNINTGAWEIKKVGERLKKL
jgi:hypothetical protein